MDKKPRKVDYVSFVHTTATLPRPGGFNLVVEYDVKHTRPAPVSVETGEQVASEDFQFRFEQGEEMSEQEMNSLAMSVASFILSRLRKSAIAEMKHSLPDRNPLNLPELFHEGELE